MPNKPVLVLGGGRHQVNLIKYIESAGYPVVLSDYLADSPGHAFASVSTLTDTLDPEANLELAKAHEVQGIITMGTDQPLVVMADVANQLGIPAYLTPESARRATDKITMFQVLREEGVNIPPYVLLSPEADSQSATAGLEYPLIVKPADSQGQRGITIARDSVQLSESLGIAQQESRADTVIVQEFLEGPEMTISAWVTAGKPQVLLITDRVTYNHPPATGVCLQHIYPSRHITGLEAHVPDLLAGIVAAYEVQEGPLYMQIVRNRDKLHLIECACRVGGGHEEHLIEYIHGIKIHQHLLSLALEGRDPEFPKLDQFPVINRNGLVNFIVSRPGTIESFREPEVIPESPEGGFYYGPGYQQGPIINSMGRIGYFVYYDPDYMAMIEGAADRYQQYAALDKDGNNLVFWPESIYLNQ